MENISKKENNLHFTVTHPLGMHARVCSRWVKLIQQISGLEDVMRGETSCPVLIRYNGEEIPANSLFKLLEARIPCGAEFDLIIQSGVEISADTQEKLDFVISKQSFYIAN
jgi:phosphotransferase system HPr-like phosphotransfer protein